MNNYLDFANSGFFYMCGGLIVLVVMIQAVLFIRLAWKEGQRIGLINQRMLKGLRAGMISAIVPSIPIIIILILLAKSLGVPFPWTRLSVIGSGPYDILSAGIGAKTMGVELGGAGYNQYVFANTLWVMTIGATWSGMIVFFFLKKIKKQYKKIENRDPQWMQIITSAAFFGVICVFLAEPVIAGGVKLFTALTGAVLMTICALAITKLGAKWLREFALPISMIGAMAGAVFFSTLFK